MYQTNKNSFGLSPSNQVVNIATLAPGASGHAVVPLICDANKIVPGPPAPTLQVSTWLIPALTSTSAFSGARTARVQRPAYARGRGLSSKCV